MALLKFQWLHSCLVSLLLTLHSFDFLHNLTFLYHCFRGLLLNVFSTVSPAQNIALNLEAATLPQIAWLLSNLSSHACTFVCLRQQQ